MKPQNHCNASGFWTSALCSGLCHCVLWILTYQSLSTSDGQSVLVSGAQGPQAVLWHLEEAKRWKAVWLLRRSCKYSEPLHPNQLCAFSLRSLCFIKINDKASVYAQAYQCIKGRALQLPISERSGRQWIRKAKPTHMYCCLHFSSSLFLFASLLEAPELDDIVCRILNKMCISFSSDLYYGNQEI